MLLINDSQPPLILLKPNSLRTLDGYVVLSLDGNHGDKINKIITAFISLRQCDHDYILQYYHLLSSK